MGAGALPLCICFHLRRRTIRHVGHVALSSSAPFGATIEAAARLLWSIALPAPWAAGFDAAVALFNRGEYHACHDVVEELWYGAEEPARTLLHGIIQCAVGFHHLFNQNHRGAMMELGEGLRKLHLDEAIGGDGPFSRFRDEVAAVLHFLYRTQKELAACTDELCLTMDGSPSSYELLGNFAAGASSSQHLPITLHKQFLPG